MSDSLPLNDVPDCRRSASSHWLVLGLLVVAHTGWGAYLAPVGNPETTSYRTVLPAVGFIFSQPLLFAFWTAFAPQRFYHRLFWGLLLCSLVSFILDCGTLLYGQFGKLGFFLSMDLILFLVATPFLLLVRRLSRWKLRQPAAEPAPSNYQVNQFGVKHLLVLTTITAFVCSLFRTQAQIDPYIVFLPVTEVARLVFRIIVLFLPMAIIPWLTLGYHKHILLSIFYAIVLLGISEAILLGVSKMICCLVFQFGTTVEVVPSILFVQLGSGTSVLLTTLVIRWCGFRMIREPETQAQIQTQDAQASR